MTDRPEETPEQGGTQPEGHAAPPPSPPPSPPPPDDHGAPAGGQAAPAPGYGPQAGPPAPYGYGGTPGYPGQPAYPYGPPPGYPTYGPYGPPVAMTQDDRTLGMLSHLLAIFTGFIGPLIIYVIKREESLYVRDQSAESLNFQITLFIAYLVSAVLMIVFIGILLLFVIWVASLVFMIMASVAGNRGAAYRYPVNIRLVK